MATYQFTTTPVQEAALAAVVAEANEQIDAQNQTLAGQQPPGTPIPHTDKTTYLRQRLADVLASYGTTHQTAIAAASVSAFLQAPPDKQEQILSLLGMADYATLPPPAISRALGTIGLANFMAMTAEQQNQIFTLAGFTS